MGSLCISSLIHCLVMKNKVIILSILLAILSQFALAQTARQPSIMVVPNESWCLRKDYKTTFTDPYTGQEMEVPDYRKAVNDQDMIIAISKINELFSDRGFPLKNMQTVLQNIDRRRGAMGALGSRSGSSTARSPLDEVNDEAKADIMLTLDWRINELGGPKKSMWFGIQSLDAYTSKQVGGASGTGEPGFNIEISSMLGEAVLSHVDNLQSQMMEHFDDLRNNGREIRMQILVWEDFDMYLDDECGDAEIIDHITNWLDDNTVGGVFNETDFTETTLIYDDVRIPLFDDGGRAINARQFGRGLVKYLEDKCSDLDDAGIKSVPRGLGEIWLVLGGK
jgi:hypothetical protein